MQSLMYKFGHILRKTYILRIRVRSYNVNISKYPYPYPWTYTFQYIQYTYTYPWMDTKTPAYVYTLAHWPLPWCVSGPILIIMIYGLIRIHGDNEKNQGNYYQYRHQNVNLNWRIKSRKVMFTSIDTRIVVGPSLACSTLNIWSIYMQDKHIQPSYYVYMIKNEEKNINMWWKKIKLLFYIVLRENHQMPISS